MCPCNGRSPAGKNKPNLQVIFALTAVYLAAAVAGRILTGSLTLPANAGQRLTDVAALGLAINAAGLLILGTRESLNLKGALLMLMAVRRRPLPRLSRLLGCGWC